MTEDNWLAIGEDVLLHGVRPTFGFQSPLPMQVLLEALSRFSFVVNIRLLNIHILQIS